MQVPILSIDLAKRVEASEIDIITSRLGAFAEREGNPMGVKIRRFGKATAFSIRNLPLTSYNTVLGIGAGDEDHIEEIIAYYQTQGVPFQFEISPGSTSPELLRILAMHGFYQSNFLTVLYGHPTRNVPLFSREVIVREM